MSGEVVSLTIVSLNLLLSLASSLKSASSDESAGGRGVRPRAHSEVLLSLSALREVPRVSGWERRGLGAWEEVGGGEGAEWMGGEEERMESIVESVMFLRCLRYLRWGGALCEGPDGGEDGGLDGFASLRIDGVVI